MAKRKLQKKARAIKTVESYATPDCSTCSNICDMTVADVRAATMTYLNENSKVQR